jgi:hypothetical protein
MKVFIPEEMRSRSLYLGALSLTAILLGLFPAACSKTYTLSPQTVASSNPNGANICAEYPTSTPGPPPSGINWASATVQLQSGGGYSVSIPLVLNGVAVTNAAVTFSGPGLTVPVPYYGTMVFSGNTYADYSYGDPAFTLTPGALYTLTTVTTSGTASAVLAVPDTPAVSSDGSTASWSGSNSFNEVAVEDTTNANITYITSQCISVNSPVNIPASAYPTTGTTYGVFFLNYNVTQSITGGTGSYWMEAQTSLSVQK